MNPLDEPQRPPEHPSVPLVRLLGCIDAKSADLAAGLHPDWVQAVELRLGIALRHEGVDRGARSRLLMAAFHLQWPALAALAPRLHRLSVLGRTDTLRVLAACALAHQRERVRLSIGRDVREWLVERLGAAAQAELAGGGAPGRSPGAEPLQPEELDLERLADRGYRLLCHAGAWTSREALALTRMCLPRAANATEPPEPDESVPSVDPGFADAVSHRLHLFFPELAWLFGSDMDRALSVPKTA